MTLLVWLPIWKSQNFSSWKAEEQSRTGFSIGSLPIIYFGLPLSSKWSKMECYQLVEKITTRITQAYSRHLSYAGRLQIINAVLFSLYNIWGAVFILPQSVLKEVDRICKDYLWGGSEEKRKLALVPWEKVWSQRNMVD